jgi:hypothetical protein
MYTFLLESSKIQLPIITNENANKSETQQCTESSKVQHSESFVQKSQVAMRSKWSSSKLCRHDIRIQFDRPDIIHPQLKSSRLIGNKVQSSATK